MNVELGLEEAFGALMEGATGPRGRAATDAIRGYALRVARGDGRCPVSDQEDCAQEVFYKLYKRLATGENPVRGSGYEACAAYVRRMVHNWVIDRWKREERRKTAREQLEDETDLTRDRDTESMLVERELREAERARARALRTLLETVARHAIDARQPRHREHLERGWHELCALVFDGRPLRELLESAGELEELEDESAFRRARNAAYKRHERTRTAIEEALGALTRDGSLDPGDAEMARLAIGQLARCQRTNSAGSATAEERS